MQETKSGGQPGSSQTVPAMPNFLDIENNLANPTPSAGTDELYTSGGEKDVKDEFTNSATAKGRLRMISFKSIPS